jgi:hypothetical protein
MYVPRRGIGDDSTTPESIGPIGVPGQFDFLGITPYLPVVGLAVLVLVVLMVKK